MKLRIARDELLTGLQRVQNVVEKRNTMPHLANVLIEAKTEGIDITATDLELTMKGLYKASVQEPGTTTISAKKLYEIFKELPTGDVDITVGENNLKRHVDRITKPGHMLIHAVVHDLIHKVVQPLRTGAPNNHSRLHRRRQDKRTTSDSRN